VTDDILDEKDARLEERFRELEYEAEIERLKKQGTTPQGHETPKPEAGATTSPSKDDPLSEMKAALDDDGELERFVLALCPHCSAKNRVSLERLRGGDPRCGGCKQDLSFSRV